MLENLLRKFTLYLFKSCSNFFINHIISRINHEFFLKYKYTQFVFFFFWYPRWLNCLKVISRLLKDSILVDLVKRTKFEDVSNFLLQVAEEFVPFFPLFPLLPSLFLSSHFSLHRSLFQRHVSTSFLNNVLLAEVFPASIGRGVYPCHPLRGFSYDPVARYVVLTIFIVRFWYVIVCHYLFPFLAYISRAIPFEPFGWNIPCSCWREV